MAWAFSLYQNFCHVLVCYAQRLSYISHISYILFNLLLYVHSSIQWMAYVGICYSIYHAPSSMLDI
jgi:uncharacterized membrane protein